jgi:hypothetical protein
MAAVYALAPQLSPLKPLWDNRAPRGAAQRRAADAVPTTVAQYQAVGAAAAQAVLAQRPAVGLAVRPARGRAVSGWGGRIGDLMLAGNGGSVFTCISVTGNAVFLTGQSRGAVPDRHQRRGRHQGAAARLLGSAAAQQALRSLITASRPAHLFADEYTRVTRRSIDAEAQVTPRWPRCPRWPPPSTATTSSAQLKMVARMIAARSAAWGTGARCSWCRWAASTCTTTWPRTTPGCSARWQCAAAFHDATVELGVVERQVTDLHRIGLRPHAVDQRRRLRSWLGRPPLRARRRGQGPRFYGTPPAVAVNGPDDVGQGRLLPTTSVDQFGATLASWFGVAESDLASVVPRVGHFSPQKIGFV